MHMQLVGCIRNGRLMARWLGQRTSETARLVGVNDWIVIAVLIVFLACYMFGNSCFN